MTPQPAPAPVPVSLQILTQMVRDYLAAQQQPEPATAEVIQLAQQ